jgi:hypothetical protein
MIYHTRVEYTNYYQKNCIDGVIVSVLDSSVIDHGLQTNCIDGVIVSVLDSSVIDHGLQKNCIDGVMVVEYTNHYTTDTVFL